MRMRKKPNLDARLEKCASLAETSPETLRGIWREKYPGFSRFLLEIGCGKGKFTAETAALEKDSLLVAIEREPSALVMAMERVQAAELRNVIFISCDAARLPELFAENEVDIIFINFCDPWPKSRDAKLRLTAPAFLRSYASVLPIGGEIRFKTDNTPLFDWSVSVFEQEGWELRGVTHDLHANGPVGVMTNYEEKFYNLGQKINRLVAVKTSATKDLSAGEPERLRNASLSDARNC